MNEFDFKSIQRSFPVNSTILFSRISRYATEEDRGIVSKNPLCINLI